VSRRPGGCRLRQPPEGGQPVIRVPLIRIVGAGIMPSRDLSLGALNALRAAGCVAYVHWIGPADFLPSLGIEEIRNLSALYHDAGVDRDNYGRVQDAVIALAIEFGDVAYLVPGNPGLGDTVKLMISKLRSSPESVASTQSWAISRGTFLSVVAP
jgi:hypothetical protein